MSREREYRRDAEASRERSRESKNVRFEFRSPRLGAPLAFPPLLATDSECTNGSKHVAGQKERPARPDRTPAVAANRVRYRSHRNAVTHRDCRIVRSSSFTLVCRCPATPVRTGCRESNGICGRR
jgi:hypothetical protein